MDIKITTKNIPTFTIKEFNEYKETIKQISEAWALRTVNKVKLDLTGIKLKVKTGRLRNSITEKVSQTQSKTKIQIGSWSAPYAEIHDKKTPTTIVPKNMSFLTVPFDKTITGRARQYPNTKVIKGSKNLLIVQMQKGGWNKILFTLRKSVKITGTGYLTDNVNMMVPMLELSLKAGTEKDLNIILNKKTF